MSAVADNPRSALRPSRALVSDLGWKLAVLVEVLVILAVWQLAQGPLELWNTTFLPPPSEVANALGDLSDSGVLWDSAAYSAKNAAVGLLIAAIAGIATGLLFGNSPLLYDIIGGPFWALYATPRIAFQPLLVLWMGFGEGPKVLIIFLMAYFPIAISTMDGVKGVNPALVRAARVFGGSRVDVFFRIQIWAALPLVLTGLRMGVARAMIGIVVGEFIGGSQGLGFLIRRRAGDLDMASAIGVTIVLVVIALIGMALLNLLRRIVAPWYVEGAASR